MAELKIQKNTSYQVITLKDNKCDYFDLINYPDGQKSICLKTNLLNIKKLVSIHCRIKTFDELEILLCLVNGLRKYDFFIEEITYYYLFGMRSDRAFNYGEPNYFRDIIAPIINSMNIPIVYIFCPHSINSFETINNANHLYYDCPCEFSPIQIGGDENNFHVSHSTNIRVDFFFSKERIERTLIISIDNYALKTIRSQPESAICIVDDLCDGGKTFIEEAKALKEHYEIKNPLYLFVAHGLFTKGIYCLLPYFDKIICTNSYQEIDHPKVEQYKLF